MTTVVDKGVEEVSDSGDKEEEERIGVRRERRPTSQPTIMTAPCLSLVCF
jgi:hypothetical protein